MTFDAAVAVAWLRAFAADVEANAGRLTDLDRPIGDSDHGVNLQRGLAAVVNGLDAPPATPGAVLVTAGTTLISSVGGASGPLFGTLFRRAGKSLGDTAAADDAALTVALRAGLDGVVKLGGAQVGVATLVDALTPAVESLEGGRSLADAAAAAADGAASTEPLIAHKGRASYLGERGVGHRDPGAESVSLLLAALARVAS